MWKALFVAGLSWCATANAFPCNSDEVEVNIQVKDGMCTCSDPSESGD
jgi:hypothetical protein